MRINLADSKGQIIVSVEIKKGDTLEKGQVIHWKKVRMDSTK